MGWSSENMKVKKVKKVKKTEVRTSNEIEIMLKKAQKRMLVWRNHYYSGKMSTKENAEALRNYTALRGVVKSLKWVLKNEEEPLS